MNSDWDWVANLLFRLVQAFFLLITLNLLIWLWLVSLSCVGQAMEQGWGF